MSASLRLPTFATLVQNLDDWYKGASEILLNRFFPVRGYPPSPLTENCSCFNMTADAYEVWPLLFVYICFVFHILYFVKLGRL